MRLGGRICNPELITYTTYTVAALPLGLTNEVSHSLLMKKVGRSMGNHLEASQAGQASRWFHQGSTEDSIRSLTHFQACLQSRVTCELGSYPAQNARCLVS